MAVELDRSRERSGCIALAVVVAGVAVIVLFAVAGRSTLVSGSPHWPVFPAWLTGPLHGLIARPRLSPTAVDDGLSAVLVTMTIAYFVALGSARSLPVGAIAAFIVLVEAILLLEPAAADVGPLQLPRLRAVVGSPWAEPLHARDRP